MSGVAQAASPAIMGMMMKELTWMALRVVSFTFARSSCSAAITGSSTLFVASLILVTSRFGNVSPLL